MTANLAYIKCYQLYSRVHTCSANSTLQCTQWGEGDYRTTSEEFFILQLQEQ